ncbi:protease II [Gordonia araii NBRC 100433]|uniref:Protease II n=1 Tax=Gordonia araii NBRC 100433 TaxID=1073574 RepID=G7H744_9ACTN|nr:S9 family peptidase [Gordonia araii]NNG97665.1 S9 family peptidase [Gordonia araii NBRC 100433]GAB11669.1 protease II [Gordonia araii NBRC 100433]
MSEQPITPPVAKKVPVERTHHGDTVIDPYTWMADKTDPEVIAFLEGQNEFVKAQTAQLKPLQDTIFNEIKSRVQETDMSVPTRSGDYWYFARTEEGKQYGISARCPVRTPDDWEPPKIDPDQKLPGEQIVLDANVEAHGHEFFSLGGVSVSEDGVWLAFGIDTKGDERYTLRFRNLDTGEELAETISDTTGGAVWSRDARYVFYQTVDDAWRPDTVWRRELGSGTPDVKVFHEPDEGFWVGMGATRSREYLFIGVGSKTTSEVYAIPTADPTAEPVSLGPRVPGVEYEVDHAIISGEGYFLFTHNGPAPDGAKQQNYAVDIAPVADPSQRTVFIAHDPARRVEDVEAFADYLVLSYRADALPRVAIADLRQIDGMPTVDDFVELRFDQPLCSAGAAGNPEWEAPRLRIGYTSFIEPTELIELDVATGERTLLKRQIVLGGYSPDDYEQERGWATADDGTRIPVSIVQRKGVDRSGPSPTLLYGYGSYEHSIDPSFSVSRLSLLDRGVVFAVAHVRGGGEMGRHWYEDGKELAKRNTFTDFIAVARHLIDSGVTDSTHLVAEGGSAGGLLMGAVANSAPELFNGIVAAVPFVDALNSILDPSLPLTVIEWEEWGNPLADPTVYEYMKSYTPYENVRTVDYPAILALNSLNDTRVLHTEAAKWAARLQDSTTGDAPILLKTEMSAGHGGVSGRYKQWEQAAFELAWILQQAGAPFEPLATAVGTSTEGA